VSGWYAAPAARSWRAAAVADAAPARDFHAALPGYRPTPLAALPAVAAELGVGRVLVKDESSRLGLPAFKVLGASWATVLVVARHLGPGVPARLDAVRDGVARLPPPRRPRLVTATDGNHGRAVAHLGRLLGLPATVFVPDVMTAPVAAAIEAEGADVVRVPGDYDVAVREAAGFAAAPGEPRELVQDTAWDGYTEVPARIVEGYRTLAAEVDDALGGPPDLVAVPVGVGSLAQAVVGHYRRPGPARRPAVLAVEPDTAACLLASLAAGRPVVVPTGRTVMAGLNCGTVSAAAWPVLRAGCDAAVSVPDAAAAAASHELAAAGVSSGPCGAATLAGVRAALTDQGRRDALGLPPDATVVLLSTEGAAASGAA
jgi:diaminopropionate ammonia-lyase